MTQPIDETISGNVIATFGMSHAGWRAGKLRTSEGEIVPFAGTCEVETGHAYTLHGHWHDDPRWGHQFKVSWGLKAFSVDWESLQKLFEVDKRFKHVGPERARALVAAIQELGGDLGEILADTDLSARLRKLSRVPRKIIKFLRENWESHKAENDTKVGLLSLDIPARIVERLWLLYGPTAFNVFSADPWSIRDHIESFSFAKADELGLGKLGMDRACNPRLEAGLVETLRNHLDDGHTWTARERLMKLALGTLQIGRPGDRQAMEARLAHMLETGDRRFAKATLPVIGEVVSDPRIMSLENKVAAEFKPGVRLSNPHFEFVDLGENWEENLAGEDPATGIVKVPNEGQKEALRKAVMFKRLVITGAAGVGKAQPLDADIVTPTGYKKMGDFKLGDAVATPSGETAWINGIFPQGEIDIYKVTFTDDISTECSLDHLWTTMTSMDRDNCGKALKKHKHYNPEYVKENPCASPGCNRGRFNGALCHRHHEQLRIHGRLTPDLERDERSKKPWVQKDRWVVRSLKEIRETLVTNNKKFNHAIPMVKPFDFTEKTEAMPLDPYFLGLLIGDGTLRPNSPTITNVSPAIIKFCSDWARANRMSLSPLSDGITYRFKLKPLRKPHDLRIKLIRVGLWNKLAHQKFVPDSYLFSSAKTRLAILQGLMDSNGTVDHGSSISFGTSSPKLAEDIKFLVESLGGNATMKKPRYTYYLYKEERRKGRLAYGVQISMPATLSPFRLHEERLAKYTPPSKYPPIRYIASIDYVGKKQAQCISVSHPSQLYVTNNFIVTHNTFTIALIVKLYLQRDLRVALAAPTGKAAKRLMEVSLQAGYLPKPITWGPRTIHKILGAGGYGDWKYNSGNKLPADVVIVDEGSMLDCELAYRVIDALESRAALVFVGDPNQLPSVGPGAILRDLIEGDRCEVAVLDKVMRHAGVLKANAQEILKGIMRPTTQETTPDGVTFTPWHVEDRHVNSKTAYESILRHFEEYLIEHGEKGLLEIQVLSPQYAHAVGVKALNRGLQQVAQRVLYNTIVSDSEDAYAFQPGDKIMQTKNDYSIDLMNGTQGICVEVNDDGVLLEVQDGTSKRIITVPKETSDGLVLSYAATVHKCVAPETIVETSNGLMPISDLSKTGVIATGEGPKRFMNLVNNPSSRMLKITTKDGYSLTVTPEHGLMTWTGEIYSKVDAALLHVGSWLRLKLGVTCDTDELAPLPQSPPQDVRAKLHSLPTRLDGDVAEFLGFMAGDGTIFKRGVRASKYLEDVIDRFIHMCHRAFSNTAKVKKYWNDKYGCWHAEINSVQISSWVSAIGGLEPNNKFVPPVILRSPLSIQSRFLKGLFEDGTVNIKSGKVDHIELSSYFPVFLETVQTLLLRFGVISSHRFKPNLGTRGIHYLYIYGKNAQRFQSKIGFMGAFKNNRLADFVYSDETKYVFPIDRSRFSAKGLKPSKALWFNQNARQYGYISRHNAELFGGFSEELGFHHDRIVKIEEVYGPSMCVEVPGFGRFLQNGFDGSNSQGSQWNTIIAAVHSEHSMNSRKLVYTAATRATKKVLLIGDRSGLHGSLRKVDASFRRTFMASPELMDRFARELSTVNRGK